MRRLNIYSALFWLSFAIYISIESCTLGLGDWRKPGPGYFPFGSALVLGICSILALLKAVRREPPEPGKISEPGGRWQNVLWVFIPLMGYVLLIKVAGFFLCTFFLVVFFRCTVAPGRWFNTILIALCVSLGFHLVFNVLLNAQLPKGFLNF
jgi:putative tricarboxylic transport membrane protein